jgi:hypothetical protein
MYGNGGTPSAGCFFDSDHRGIPIVGSLFLSMHEFVTFSPEKKHNRLMHELTHILAFSTDPVYTDNWTDLATGRKHVEVVRNVSFRGSETKALVTPKVLERARELYG